MLEQKRPFSPPQMILSAAGAVLVWTAIGFSWFGYGFNWTTNAGAERMSYDVVTERLATICAAQARAMPEADVAIGEMVAQDNWKRRQFIEAKGWASMPGSDSPESGVATLCAQKLLPS
jgi:hypothetical protein